MRHLRKGIRLNRSQSHRRALMRALATALLKRDRIRTTDAKAKVLRPYVERLVTLGKNGSLASRRLAVRRVGDEKAVRRLFQEIAPRYATRAGGYTRIVKIGGFRPGDAARLSQIEFV